MSGCRQASHAGSWYSSSGKFCQIFLWTEHHIGDDFNLMTCMVLLFLVFCIHCSHYSSFRVGTMFNATT